MTTALATTRHAAPDRPDLSRGLAAYVSTDWRASDVVLTPPRWTPAELAEATAALPAFEARCAAVTREHVDAWLTQLLAARLGGRVPADEAAMAAYIDAVVLASGDVPALAWSADALRAGLRRWKFWPTPAEVDEVVRPIGAEILAQRDRVRRIAAAAPVAALPAPDPAPEAAEIRAAVAAQLRTLVQEREREALPVADPAPAGPRRPPRPVDPELLRQIRDADPMIQRARAARDAGGPARSRS